MLKEASGSHPSSSQDVESKDSHRSSIIIKFKVGSLSKHNNLKNKIEKHR